MTVINPFLFEERETRPFPPLALSAQSVLCPFHLSVLLPLSFLSSGFVNNSLYG